jgi:hypothetical protein
LPRESWAREHAASPDKNIQTPPGKVAMEKLEIVLYGGAVYVAIKSLVSLMADHTRSVKQRVAEELAAAKRAAEEAAAKAALPPEKPEQVPKKKVA